MIRRSNAPHHRSTEHPNPYGIVALRVAGGAPDSFHVYSGIRSLVRSAPPHRIGLVNRSVALPNLCKQLAGIIADALKGWQAGADGIIDEGAVRRRVEVAGVDGRGGAAGDFRGKHHNRTHPDERKHGLEFPHRAHMGGFLANGNSASHSKRFVRDADEPIRAGFVERYYDHLGLSCTHRNVDIQLRNGEGVELALGCQRERHGFPGREFEIHRVEDILSAAGRIFQAHRKAVLDGEIICRRAAGKDRDGRQQDREDGSCRSKQSRLLMPRE